MTTTAALPNAAALVPTTPDAWDAWADRFERLAAEPSHKADPQPGANEDPPRDWDEWCEREAARLNANIDG